MFHVIWICRSRVLLNKLDHAQLREHENVFKFILEVKVTR